MLSISHDQTILVHSDGSFCTRVVICQQKSKSDNKTTRGGRQAKKPKVETESHNIREMFTRASSRRKK